MDFRRIIFYAKEFELIRMFLTKMSIRLGIATYKNSIYRLRNFRYKKLKRRFFDLIPTEKVVFDSSEEMNKQIFVYWNTGFENAPELVRKCVASLSKQKDYEVVLLNDKNLNDYIDLPEFIIEKYKNGFIENANFSDLIKTKLMFKYGGVWVDATVFLSNEIPEEILEQPLFLMKHETFVDSMNYGYNSWFIASRKNNPILNILLRLLYEYWKKENYLLEYFTWDLFVLLIEEKQPEYFDKLLTYIDYDAHIFQNYLFKKIDDKQWTNILEKSFIHKLTHKYKSSEIREDSFIKTNLIKRCLAL